MGSFGKKGFERLFCSTNKLITAERVFRVDSTFQHRRTNHITATRMSTSMKVKQS